MSNCKQHLEQLSQLGLLTAKLCLHLGQSFEALAVAQQPNFKGPAKACYQNAAEASFQLEGFIYCEGFACPPGLFPMQHAWCVTNAGLVFDPTWEQAGDTEYFGVAFDSRFLFQHLAESKMWGVFADHLPEQFVFAHPDSYLHRSVRPDNSAIKKFQDETAALRVRVRG